MARCSLDSWLSRSKKCDASGTSTQQLFSGDSSSDEGDDDDDVLTDVGNVTLVVIGGCCLCGCIVMLVFWLSMKSGSNEMNHGADGGGIYAMQYENTMTTQNAAFSPPGGATFAPTDDAPGAKRPAGNPRAAENPLYGHTTESTFAVGDRVDVDGKGAGIVRFVGPHHLEGTQRLGVELDGPDCKNDGTVKGHRYFSCRPGFGCLIKPNRATACVTAAIAGGLDGFDDGVDGNECDI